MLYKGLVKDGKLGAGTPPDDHELIMELAIANPVKINLAKSFHKPSVPLIHVYICTKRTME